jgi:hypothetical protein
MKILTLTNMYPTPAEPWFGCFVRDQVEDLRALGADVTVLSFDGRRSRAAYAVGLARTRRAARRGYNLIHAHYGLTGAVALGQRRLPVATTFWGSDGNIPWQALVSRAVARRTAAVCVTPALAEKLGVPDATIVPGGVDLVRFGPRDRREARTTLGWAPELPYALFPSRRTNAVKRFDLFEAAVDEARRQLPALQTATLDGLDRDGVATAMAAADVTVLTSDSEGSPVTVKESLASETPVVSVAVGDVPAVLAGLPGCAICERDPSLLGRAIASAIETPSTGALRDRAESYGRERAAARLLDLFQTVVRGGA